MFDFLIKLLNFLPPLHSKKNIQLAAVLGFFFRDLGIGLYFKSFIDFVLSISISLIVFIFLISPNLEKLVEKNSDQELILLLFISGFPYAIYGYLRAKTSNEKQA